MLLKDRVAIVTGGNWGIGRRICLEFAREGADIVGARSVAFEADGGGEHPRIDLIQ